MADLVRKKNSGQEPDIGGVSVEVRDTAFLPERSAPTDGLFCHAYTVVGRNTGAKKVSLTRRYWRAIESGGGTYGVSGRTIAGQRSIELEAGGAPFEYRTLVSFRTPSATLDGRLQGDGIRALSGFTSFEVTAEELEKCKGKRADEDEFVGRIGPHEFKRLCDQLWEFKATCARSERAYEPMEVEFGEEDDRIAFENLLLKKFPETYNNKGWLDLSRIGGLPELEICDLFALIDAAAPLGRVHIFGKTPRTQEILQVDGGGAIIPSAPHIGGRGKGILPDAISSDDAIVTISLKDVPRRAWPKVSAELAYVLKVAVETGGNGTAIRAPSRRRVSELSESSLEKKRERERKNMARYRQRLRQKAAGSPQL